MMHDLIDYNLKNIIDVQTGEVKSAGHGNIITSNAIGSCIAAIMFNENKCIGGIAHIMLPGKAPENNMSSIYRYGYNGLKELIRLVKDPEIDIDSFILCLAGGANILRDPHDTIAKENISYLIGLCSEMNLKIYSQSLGGFSRRKVILDIDNKSILCSIEDNPYFLLWKY